MPKGNPIRQQLPACQSVGHTEHGGEPLSQLTGWHHHAGKQHPKWHPDQQGKQKKQQERKRAPMLRFHASSLFRSRILCVINTTASMVAMSKTAAALIFCMSRLENQLDSTCCSI